MTRREIRIIGLGGQGAITAGYVLGVAAALYDKKEAVMSEGYSPYITGGWSRSDVVVSDESIDYPLITELDYLIAMHQEGLDLNRELVRPGGTIFVETSLVDPKGVEGRKVVPIPALSIAEELGRKVVTNIVLLGAFAGSSDMISVDAIKQALAVRFPKALQLNMQAFDKGYAIARELV